MNDFNSTEISHKQALKYAKELSRLYNSEREKRKQLEVANEELEKLRNQLEKENVYLREEVQNEMAFGNIVGNSSALKRVLQEIELVSESDATVLIEGETGTGKELVAREIHQRSRRNQHTMVKVNCGAVPRDLFESEFFGHVKGAYTGAVKDRVGRFQLADRSTLFLDEVGEIPLDLQSKFLRVLQEGQFERVGDECTKTVDVRILAATNRNLKNEISEGRFREDLYYRLSVIPIRVPSLRERKEDIESLAIHFINQISKQLNTKRVRFDESHLKQLLLYDWPGNIREFQNVIERAVITSRNGHLKFDLNPSPSDSANAPETFSLSPFSEKDWKNLERDNVLAALKQSNWKIYGPDGAGKLLGIKPATLAYRIKKMGIKKYR